MEELRDQIALVTGASGAIGKAIAEALADHGARLILVGRDADKLHALAEDLRGRSPEIDVQPLDLTDDAKVRRLAARIKGSYGALDILVHSAGAFAAGRLAEAPVDELDRLLRINTRVPYLLTQLLLPGLESRRGQIVFINSSAAPAPRARIGAYAASKAALRALADALRDEVNRSGVRVLSVFPGRTASAMQEEVRRFEGKDYEPSLFLQPSEVAAEVARALTLPRTAEVTDIHLRPMQPVT